MKSITTRTLELKGSSYEIGQALGRIAASIPPMKNYYMKTSVKPKPGRRKRCLTGGARD